MPGKNMIHDYANMFENTRQRMIEFLPDLAGALLIMLTGILVALLVRALTSRLLRNLGRVLPKGEIRSRLSAERMVRPAKVISRVLYWIILFFFLTAATEILGLPIMTTWFSGIANYLPKILVAALIVFAGVIGGMVVRDVVRTAAVTAGIDYGNVLGRLTQYGIIVVSIFIAVEQIGIDIQFLTTLITILFAGALFGAALAFGLGARTAVSNILSSHYTQKIYRVGHTAKIQGMEGRIVRITPTFIILEGPDEQVCVPAKLFSELTSVRIREDR